MPGRDLCLLSLDGGGVHGLSSLQILKQLMATIDPESPPKPCDYFDVIGGTSTGGLLAIMLGRLQMDVDECINAYTVLSDKIFQQKRHRVTLKGHTQGRFDSKELERAIKEIVMKRGLEEDALLKDVPDAKCKVFVCATSQETGDTVHLTSYRPRRGRDHLFNVTKIWEAGRATSAASSFFDSIKIGDFGETFVDGATGANNPVGELWNEAKDLWSSEPLEDNIKCLVSIGTGVPSLKAFGDNLLEIGRSLLAIATETEQTAERFCRDKSGLYDEGRYFRFNVLRGLEDIGLEDSKQKNAIMAVTSRYVESQAVFAQMKACGSNLAGRESQDYGPYRIPFSLKGIPVINDFVDRASEMEQLKKILLPRAMNKERKIFILLGLGGIGKTQLSVEFARKHWSKYSSVFWLDGRTKESLKRSIAAIAKHITKGQIPEASRSYTHGNSDELDAVINDVLDWLSLEGNKMWLLIFDNVDRDHSLIQDANAYDIEDYLPGGDHGYILVTTRLISLAQLGTLLELKGLKDDQAMTLLEQRTKQSLNNSPDAMNLLARLGGLPLAIAQAGAFIHARKLSISKYVEYYEKKWMDLKLGERSLKEYHGGIQTTWNISYDHIKQEDETAANLLKLWAHLDNKDFWYGLLSPTSALQHAPLWFQKIASDEWNFLKAIGVLQSYSMVEVNQDLDAYSMHPVVHEWALQWLSNEGKDDFVWLAATIVAEVIPDIDQKEYWVLQQRLLPHADRCCRFIQDSPRTKLNVENEPGYKIKAHAMHALGNLYWYQGKLAEAEAMYRRALVGNKKALGPDHPSTLMTVHNLGNLYSDQGKFAEAEAMYRRALAGNEKALGPDHPSTLTTVHNLGNLYSGQGKLVGAGAMYRRALAGNEKALGPDHTPTLGTER